MKAESSIKHVNVPVADVYATLSNLENLRPLLAKAQEDEALKRRMAEAGQADALDGLRNVELTNDSISVVAPMFGTISLRIVDREPAKCVKFMTDQSPIAATAWIQTLPVTDATSKLKLTVDADLPFMLGAMIGSKLKEGVEKVADAIAAGLSASH